MFILGVTLAFKVILCVIYYCFYAFRKVRGGPKVNKRKVSHLSE